MARLLSTAAWSIAVGAAAAVAWSERARETPPAGAAAAPQQVAAVQPAAALAMPLEAPPVPQRPILVPAEGDPFQLQPPTAPVAPPVPVPAQAAAMQPPPPPAPPPLALQFAGRMVAPDGSPMIFAMTGNGETVQLTPGQTLPNGYQVKAIAPTHVELAYGDGSEAVRLEIPPPPAREIR